MRLQRHSSIYQGPFLGFGIFIQVWLRRAKGSHVLNLLILGSLRSKSKLTLFMEWIAFAANYLVFTRMSTNAHELFINNSSSACYGS